MLTQAITALSPALDREPSTDADCTGTDERGETRPNTGHDCDAGAFELQNVSYKTLTVSTFGHGTVTGSGIDCPSDCSQAYATNSVHSLKATADGGSSVTATFTTANQPDGTVKKSATAAALGVGIFNADGTGQTAKRALARGRTGSFILDFTAGTNTDTLTLTGCPSPRGFKIKYLIGGTDETTNVQAGKAIPVNAGQTIEMTVQIHVKARGPGSTTCLTSATSSNDGSLDAVGAQVKVKA